ncbi:hypothetical protein BGZ95_004907 [Linnemannia exigua]|uniref:Uncharacterized protein n=1 Tax=Linnemannia exigua TaxID=604196 RepID=A0AAD4D2H0_9FUNG|nr:hypothetical protein BGZ95_004907 [Linnemannia exigua]
MDTDPKPAPVPAKLRWRPYANGTSKKNSTKIKKVDTPAPNPKAIAHKIRPSQYYSNKPNHTPVKVSLQWEEAETAESMSHGGHPHNHHQYHHRSFDSASSRDSSPGAVSDTSSPLYPTKQRASSTSSTGSSGSNNSRDSNNGNNVLTSPMQRAMASLPSPPPSKPLSTGLDLVGGPTDLSFFKASIPGLLDNSIGSGQHTSVGLDSMTPNNAYQIALNALLQSRTIEHSAFHTAALMDARLISNTNNTDASSAALMLGSSTIHDTLLSDPNRILSTEELLGVSTIDELLASCGVMEECTPALTTQLLASPTDSNSSLTTTPMNSLLDFNSSGMVARATTTNSSNTFSPMAITNQSFEALLSQSSAPQQLPFPQQQPSPISPVNTSATASPATVDALGNLVQILSLPFGYLSSGDAFTAGTAPTAWPSLFPTFAEDTSMVMDITTSTVSTSTPQKSEMATQTEAPYVAPLSPESTASATHGSQRGTPSPLSTALGLTDDELDPDWLSFLDEASPLFNEVDMPSPPPSGDEGTSYTQTTTPKGAEQRTRSTWGWGSAVPPAGHRGLPSASTMTGIPGGSIGGGGLVRTLQGVGQQKSVKPSSKAPIPTESPASENETQSGTTKESKVVAPSDPAINLNEKTKKENEDSWAGLIHMIKGLWSGGGGDSNNNSDK